MDLMDALKKSLATEAGAKGKKPRKAAAGQKEMLLPIEGKKPAPKKRPSPSVLPGEGRPVRPAVFFFFSNRLGCLGSAGDIGDHYTGAAIFVRRVSLTVSAVASSTHQRSV